MTGTVGIALHTLPVESNPEYSAKITLETLRKVIIRAERTLAPSIIRRLLGGNSRDHARAVIAAANEEIKAIKHTLFGVKNRMARHGQTALGGSIERLLKLIDQWREVAIEFEEATYGSDEKLLMTTRRVLVLANDLRDPAAGIY